MRRLEGERDLTRDLERLLQLYGAALETIRQRTAFEKLQDEKAADVDCSRP